MSHGGHGRGLPRKRQGQSICGRCGNAYDGVSAHGPGYCENVHAGPVCDACGGTNDVRQRGWHDDGDPMATCANCGDPPGTPKPEATPND